MFKEVEQCFEQLTVVLFFHVQVRFVHCALKIVYVYHKDLICLPKILKFYEMLINIFNKIWYLERNLQYFVLFNLYIVSI